MAALSESPASCPDSLGEAKAKDAADPGADDVDETGAEEEGPEAPETVRKSQ